MESQKNNKGIITLLIIIIAILSVICILLATGTISFNSNKENNDIDNNKTNQNIIDNNAILEEMVGVWGYSYNNHVIEIKKENDKYYYLQGQYATDGARRGVIENTKEIATNKYELEVFIEGCKGPGCMEETEDETKIITIEVDNTKNIIINNNNEYKFITKDYSNYDEINKFFNNEKSWTDYLLSMHILDAKITRIRSKELGDTEDINKIVTIAMDDIKEIFNNLKKNKISKEWSQGRGGQIRDNLIISYEKNYETYKFEMLNGTIIIDKLDNDFKNILEKNKYDEKNIEYKNTEGSFYFYNIDNYNETIFEKYFK